MQWFASMLAVSCLVKKKAEEEEEIEAHNIRYNCASNHRIKILRLPFD